MLGDGGNGGKVPIHACNNDLDENRRTHESGLQFKASHPYDTNADARHAAVGCTLLERGKKGDAAVQGESMACLVRERQRLLAVQLVSMYATR